MGGFGVLAWIGIGAAAGWVISRLMVSAEDDALRGTAAGMVGGIFGGLAMRLIHASPATGGHLVNASFGALAGSLWLTWIVCVVTSGHWRDSETPRSEVRVTVRDPAPEIESARPALSYGAARDARVTSGSSD